jgi:Zn finger protein HypA/HybF involved in hydrogenase expression
MGDGLETYIKYMFSGVSFTDSIKVKAEKIHNTFSYLGNQNNPPDMILKNSDAIEVKKIQNRNSPIALNSSYPKQKLYATDQKITNACKHCEYWNVKDMIYAIGVTGNNNLQHLSLICGDCYAASAEIYNRISEKIKNGILEIPDTEFTKTKELGRVNKIDPLGITNLRIRGMWHIANPLKVFNEIYNIDKDDVFNLLCLMKTDKFEQFCEVDKLAISADKNIDIADIKIKNPDNLYNTVQFLDAKLITAKVLL